ncbi:MAG: hypothetical protein PHG47_04705 [Sulfuricella sp.]|nr:hypothetical protein [Sulfuricella sp.]
MFKSLLNDWKYLIMLAATLAGIFSPLWLTRIQSTDKDLVVNLVSQSSLQPATTDATSDLKLVMDGKELVNPYLSVLRITNVGTKPILSKDFEAPFELHLGQGNTPVRVKVTAKSPPDIQAEIDLADHAIHLKPTLLNPQDSLTVEILSTGGAPSFSTKTRIAGIGAVQIHDASSDGPKPAIMFARLFIAFALVIPSVAVITRLSFIGGVFVPVAIHNRTLVALWATSFFSSEIVLIQFLEAIDMSSMWQILLGMILLFIVATPFARILEPTGVDNAHQKP